MDRGVWTRHGLDRIFLGFPDSTDERLRVVCENARGFVYAASRMGVTGERSSLGTSPEDLWPGPVRPGPRMCVWASASPPLLKARPSGSMQTGSSLDPPWSYTLLTEDGDARELTSGLAALAAKTAELAEGIHNARL